jgi:lipopolysaccharide transport system ATP-binding protein
VSLIALNAVGKSYALYRHGFDRIREALTGQSRSRRIVALHPLSMTVDRGEIVGLVGRNGAGKSTLLKLISGMLLPTSGELQVNGKVAPLLELGAGFHPDLTGRENIFLAGAVMGFAREQLEELFDSILAFSEIGHFIDLPVKTYSSGMFVRLAFSLATCVQPQILIVDEALSVGDGGFARRSFDRIMGFKDAGTTILFCSHSMYQVEALCTRVLWIHEGRVLMDGDPGAVVSEYSSSLASSGVPASSKAKVSKETPRIRSGAGVARIRSVRLRVDGVERDLPRVTANASTLALEISLLSDLKLPVPTLGIIILDGERRTIASAGSLNDGLTLPRNAGGESTVRVEFPRIPLLKGRYYIDVFLLCEKAVHVYDGVKGAIRFDVEQHNLEQGVVSLQRTWHGTGFDD